MVKERSIDAPSWSTGSLDSLRSTGQIDTRLMGNGLVRGCGKGRKGLEVQQLVSVGEGREIN